MSKTTAFILFSALLLMRPPLHAEEATLSKEHCTRLAFQARCNFGEHVLGKWFPRSVDKGRGGFIQDYSEDWSEKRDGDKTLVYQSRLTWMAAQIVLGIGATNYGADSEHGLNFLADKMWDKENGGFYWGVDPFGKARGDRAGTEKHMYGIAFALYAASTNYKATMNPKALELAIRTFVWMDVHAHDEKHGGYFEALDLHGKPMLEIPKHPDEPSSDFIGTRYGVKSMNTHIHILEALTAFYEVHPEKEVRERLKEIFEIVRDKICVMPGAMHLYFNPDWTPVPDLDSFGHDLETAYLLVEAAAALGQHQDAKTWAMARGLVDHALEFGWDAKLGGFYDEGGTFRKVWITDKVWWVQAEGLNALLLLADYCARENQPVQAERYAKAFVKEWEFIQKFQIDAKHGGWITMVNADGSAKPGQSKSDQWKEPYHQGRALLNVIERLERMAQ